MRSKYWSVLLIINLLLVFTPTSADENLEEDQVPNLIPGVADSNANFIDDVIERKETSSPMEVVVHIQEGYPIPNSILNQEVKYRFSSISAVQVDLSPSQIQSIAEEPWVEYVEYNHRYYPLLIESTKHMGLPSSFWSDSISGQGELSIAVVDSGLDRDHPAFGDRVIATYNAINDNASAPVDNVGHGTHVTGIAAGSHEVSGKGYQETNRGLVPSSCTDDGCPLSLAHQLSGIKSNTQIRVQLDWSDKGSDQPGSEVGFAIFDPTSSTNELACTSCYVTSTTGYIDTTLTLSAGSYYIGILSESGGLDEYYESSITYERDDYPQQDGNVNGVAYGANIVGVKVLDGLSGGDLDTFDRAVTWIIDHREEYKIAVVNLSLGLNQTSVSLDEMMGTLADNGILPVSAAGNLGLGSQGIYSPASAAESLTVGSVNRIGEVAYYTNAGSDRVNGDAMKPDVLAPGGSYASKALGFDTDYNLGFGLILSADAALGFDQVKNDLTGYQGTSMAAPHVAGLALLIASEIYATSNWDWTSRADVMRVKQLILAGTYEVGNIGNGREQLPNTSTGSFPSIDRNAKDYQEGWGAIDTRAIYNLFNSTLTSDFSEELNFNLQNPDKQKVYGWKMEVSAALNYGFTLDVPSNADLDIKIIDASGTDDGDLVILDSTSKGLGEDEGIGFIPSKDMEVFVIVSIIDASTTADVSATFTVSELAEVPEIEITAPFEGQELENPIVLEFVSDLEKADLYVDNEYVGLVASGYQLGNMIVGEHTIRLVITSDTGLAISDSITFEVVEEIETTSEFNLNYPIFYFSLLIIALPLRRRFLN